MAEPHESAAPRAHNRAEKKERKKLGPLATMLGAACSVALVLGVSVWTYNLGKRDAMEVPVIKAMTGPTRIEPEDRGGVTTPHQGLAVNRVLEGGGVRPVARSVVTAPTKDALATDDLTSKELTALANANAPKSRPAQAIEPTMQETAAVKDPAPKPETATSSVDEATPLVVARTDNQVSPDARKTPAVAVAGIQDPAPERPTLGNDVTNRATVPTLASTPLPDMPVAVETQVAAASETTPAAEETPDEPIDVASLAVPAVGSGSIHAPAVTQRTRTRPKDLNVELSNAVDAAVNAAVQAAASASTAGTPEPETAPQQQANLDVIPLPAGTRMIQLGAYDSEAVARREWDRFRSQHSDLLGSKDSYVQRIDSSGRVFFRLRVAGYQSGRETRAACAALSARGVPCITATIR